jgi:hypothetical protein
MMAYFNGNALLMFKEKIDIRVVEFISKLPVS